jgi:hypothetical protein
MLKEDILEQVWHTDLKICKLPIVLNSDISLIKKAMEIYARQVGIDFMNWTLGPNCEYSVNDEDSWKHNYNITDQISTKELYELYLKEIWG